MPDGLESFSERLNIIKEHYNYTDADLADVCGVSRTAIQKFLAGGIKNVKANLLSNLETKLSLSLRWLMYGEGEMFKEGAKVNSNNTNKSHNNTINESIKTKKNNQTQEVGVSDASKDVVIESLKRENELLRSQLERANKTIDMLLEKK